MYVEIILKICTQQMGVNMFHQVFQCLQYDQYQHRKLAGYIERETLHKKGLWIFKGARNEDN